MITQNEAKRALYAVAAVARAEPDAIRRFDLSVDGFWRSFWAMALAFPFVAVILFHGERAGPETGWTFWSVVAQLLAFPAQYVFGALLALALLSLLGLGRSFVPMVVAANWATVPQNALVAFAAYPTASYPDYFGSTLLVPAMLAVIFLQWRVIRAALGVPATLCMGYLMAEILASLLWSGFTMTIVDGVAAWGAAT